MITIVYDSNETYELLMTFEREIACSWTTAKLKFKPWQHMLRGKKHLQYIFFGGEDYLQIESANPSAALFSLYSNWHEGPKGINTFTPHKAPTQLTYSYEG
jgi:hypothetical protein